MKGLRLFSQILTIPKDIDIYLITFFISRLRHVTMFLPYRTTYLFSHIIINVNAGFYLGIDSLNKPS